ncbi:hypothetical protein QYF36_016748 [Acer negundo]|nr:hypothetical protein QYF36_016748 [Acer negundo]
MFNSLSEARVHNYTWDITYQYKSQDCYKKLAITINGMTPGPVISATEGDTIIVNVINKLFMENFAIHWHSIKQIGTPWMDGADGVSQCATIPGTYMYHSHYAVQKKSGLYGLIKVTVRTGKSEPFKYDDDDHSIVLTDWYHSSSYEEATKLTSLPFVWIGEPQSLLINGRGKYDCSNLNTNVCDSTNPECVPYSLTVVPGKTYRLRIASLTSLSSLSFQIEGHNLTVVEADGQYVEPFVTKNLYIYSGETFCFGNSKPGLFQELLDEAYLERQRIKNQPKSGHQSSPALHPEPSKHFRQSDYASQHTKHHPGPNQVVSQQCLSHSSTHSLSDSPEKNWTDVFYQTPAPESYDFQNYDIYNVPGNKNSTSSTSIYRLKFNSTVDVILQNANTMNVNNSETHPWHLHGHDFWVLGYGDGKFNMSSDVKKYNLVDPIMKSTVPLHPYGWTALRFQADNPGIWLFHCHIEAHFLMGMLVLFESGSEMVREPPQQNIGCGRTKSLIKP